MDPVFFRMSFLPKLSAFLVVFLCSQVALGASVAQEREALRSLQSDLAKQKLLLVELQSGLSSLPDTILEAEKAAAKADDDFQIQNRDHENSKKEHASSPSEGTDRKIRLSKIKTGLAESKVRSTTRNLEKLQRKLTELNNKISETEAAMKSGQAKIARQEQNVQKAVRVARQKEINDEKAKIAVVTPVVEPPKQKIQIKVPEKIKVEPLPATEKLPDSPTITLSDDEFEEFQFAREKITSANELASKATENEQPNFEQLKIGGSKIDNAIFSYLGNQQHRADITLASGRHKFRVDSVRFSIDVPDSEESLDYVFLVDARNRNKLRISYFKKTMLSYLDKKVAKATPQTKNDQQFTINGHRMSKSEFEEYQFASEKISDFENLISQKIENEKPNYSDLQLRSDNIDDTTFIYSGNQQYRLDVTLTSGRHSFRIDDLRFRVNVPASEIPTDYIFIVDGRDRDQLKASYFKKSLLRYMDAEVANVR